MLLVSIINKFANFLRFLNKNLTSIKILPLFSYFLRSPFHSHINGVRKSSIYFFILCLAFGSIQLFFKQCHIRSVVFQFTDVSHSRPLKDNSYYIAYGAVITSLRVPFRVSFYYRQFKF